MSNSTCPNQNLNVKHVATLFDEVQNRYVNKLLSIDEKHINIEERQKQKLIIYENYVKDLSIQTRLLLQSLEELEREANQRVNLLETKLRKAHTLLQHQPSSVDGNKKSNETEKWQLTHENLDLKHDLECLTTFINTAKRTGKWDTKRLQLKTLSLDRIVGLSNDESPNPLVLHKEIQYRDERIQVLQAELEHFKRKQLDIAKQSIKLTNEEEFKSQNIVLVKKVEDLRSKLAEECQKSETLKMDIRLKTTQLKDLQQELTDKKQQYEIHIHDLSSKLKIISDRHRESTNIINNDIKLKKQQIEQLTEQVEQVIKEKISYENERSELQRQCRMKDAAVADFEVQMRTLERELALKSLPPEPSVPKIEHDKLEQELQTTRKQIENLTLENQSKEILINKLEQDITLIKKFHDEKFQEHIQTTTNQIDQYQTEIRSLKRLCEEKTTELQRQSHEIRSCQDHLSIEHSKNTSNEQEHQQLRQYLQIANEQTDQLRNDLKNSQEKFHEYEQTIEELNTRNYLLENKFLETMTLIDLRNKSLIDMEDQLKKYQNDFIQKQKDLIEKQNHIDELEKNLIEKTGEVAQLTEILETEQIKTQHREENVTKTQIDIENLQRELRDLSQALVEREHTNTSLNEQIQKLTNDLRHQQDELHQKQKSFNKQINIKQEHLIRYDQNLHEMEIQCKYAKEECLIQEKEIIRLNTVQEEQENRINLLQQDLLKVQEQRDAITIQYERSEADLRNLKLVREDEQRRYTEEFERLNQEISSLKTSEIALLKNLDELKDNLSILSNERDEYQEQNEQYQNELENIQKLLYEETETSSKSASTVLLLTRQIEEDQRRTNNAINQFNDIQLQLQSALMNNETLKSELNQARTLIQDHLVRETEYKQNINRITTVHDERKKYLEDREREIETLNQLLINLQNDYEKSKDDLSYAHNQLVQIEISNQTHQQHLVEKTNELTIVSNRLQQLQQDLHLYEKEHRYSNDEYFEREQRLKLLENELINLANNYEKSQKEQKDLNDQLDQYRYDLDQIEKSDMSHKERLMQSIDEGKIYKQKLALLGDCFKTLVRKASETSEQWANLTTHFDEQIVDLTDDVDRLQTLDERLEYSTKILTNLRSQHEDVLVNYFTLKPILEKIHIYIRNIKRHHYQINDENRHFKIENKRLRDKLEDFHRAEHLMHTKIDEQEIIINQLRKERTNELQTHSETQVLIEQLKRKLDETVYERDQILKNITTANRKVENLENNITGLTNEIRLLQQTIEKLEKQLGHFQTENHSLEQTNQIYQEKLSECEKMLISLREANRNKEFLLEQKKSDLNSLQALNYEQAATIAKLEKFEEINQEYQRHISVLERAVEEHKRLVRKREKEVDQIKENFENTMLNTSSLSNKCTKQDAEMSILRMENTSLKEELRLMRENVTRCQQEQKRLRQGCDQALNYIQDGISDMCLDNEKNEQIFRTYFVQTNENLSLDKSWWFSSMTNVDQDKDKEKKYQLMKAYSKQQQLLLNQLEAHVQFYENTFDKSSLPALEYSSTK